MLLLLFILWAGLVAAICAVCAAGGAADQRREKWHAELKRKEEEPGAGGPKEAA
jgi:hypothetical protein